MRARGAGGSASERIYRLIRSHAVGLVLVFLALTGTAIAGQSAKRLSKQTKELEARLGALQAQPGPPGPQGPRGTQGPDGVTSPPIGSAGGDFTGSTYPNPVLKPGAVNSAKVLDGSLLGTSISDNGGAGTLASADIANNSVASGDIANATIAAADVAANTLTGAEINESALFMGIPETAVSASGPSCDPTFAVPSKICTTTLLAVTRSRPVLILGKGMRQTVPTDDPSNPSDDPNAGFGDCFLRVDGSGLGSGVAHLVSAHGPNPGPNDEENFFMLAVVTLAAGSHTLDVECDESDGDLRITFAGISAVQLGT